MRSNWQKIKELVQNLWRIRVSIQPQVDGTEWPYHRVAEWSGQSLCGPRHGGAHGAHGGDDTGLIDQESVNTSHYPSICPFACLVPCQSNQLPPTLLPTRSYYTQLLTRSHIFFAHLDSSQFSHIGSTFVFRIMYKVVQYFCLTVLNK